jgi:hypothetical protein
MTAADCLNRCGSAFRAPNGSRHGSRKPREPRRRKAQSAAWPAWHVAGPHAGARHATHDAARPRGRAYLRQRHDRHVAVVAAAVRALYDLRTHEPDRLPPARPLRRARAHAAHLRAPSVSEDRHHLLCELVDVPTQWPPARAGGGRAGARERADSQEPRGGGSGW